MDKINHKIMLKFTPGRSALEKRAARVRQEQLIIPEEQQNLNEPMFVEALLEKAKKFNETDRIQCSDFAAPVGPYSPEKINNDIANTKKMNDNFNAKNSAQEKYYKKIADIMEAIFHHQIEGNDYFGPNAYTIKTCDYDDFRNHIDSIIEIRHEQPDGQKSANHFSVALDVTSSMKERVLKQKTNRILDKIRAGELANIEYFESKYLQYRGPKNDISLFVIGCDIRHLQKIAQLWYNDQQKTLARHPIQALLIEQIKQQAQFFCKYAKYYKQPKIAAIYQQVLDEFDTILAERSIALPKIYKNERDEEKLYSEKTEQNFKNDAVWQGLQKIIKYETQKIGRPI